MDREQDFPLNRSPKLLIQTLRESINFSLRTSDHLPFLSLLRASPTFTVLTLIPSLLHVSVPLFFVLVVIPFRFPPVALKRAPSHFQAPHSIESCKWWNIKINEDKTTQSIYFSHRRRPVEGHLTLKGREHTRLCK